MRTRPSGFLQGVKEIGKFFQGRGPVHKAMRRALEEVQAQFGRTYPLVLGKDSVLTETVIDSVNPSHVQQIVGRWGRATGANVVHGVGGSFDVLAGATRRAPGWCQTSGLEWLYRVTQEPGRLGKRYLTTNTAFIALVARELIRGGHS